MPLVEANIVEGLRNNVLGAQVIANAAERFKVDTCVLISSDKAVRPTNIMGASKRIAELIFQAAAARFAPHTTFCMVRFGNVLGSSGSVIPLFQRQIAHGGPLTITHPEVSRYFMLIAEAAQLVIQAGAMAEGGDVFVLDMGEPIRIVDLARTMIVMSGLTEKTAHTSGRRYRNQIRRPIPRRKTARGITNRRQGISERPSAHHAHERKRPAPRHTGNLYHLPDDGLRYQ